jgi:hypothetical protein
VLLFFDGIILARYVYIFRLKNPAAFPDDFWHRFLNTWIFWFCTASQVPLSKNSFCCEATS